jgi:hypothetical protein
MAVVGAFLIGCAVFLVLGGAGVRSEAPQEEQQEHTEATKEQGRSPEATASEEALCDGTRTFKQWDTVFTTNDLPGCPEGGLLSGTDKPDFLDGRDGEDEMRGLGAGDFISGGAGNDVIYGGPGDDGPFGGDEGDDVVYGGDGEDSEFSGGKGEDILYGGDGSDFLDDAAGPIADHQRDKLYCGAGRDIYFAGKGDYVSSSCERRHLLHRFKEGVP